MANENKTPYIFISYAHADSSRVLPTVQSMKNANISLWYDEGIVAGSEWPEFIAEKVVDCHKFILFISESYLNSQNCKRELNFAISRKKNILAVFLEEVHLSPGMEMQLGTYQAVFRNRFASDADFWASLCREPFFDSCRIGKPTATPPVTNHQNPEPTVRYTPGQNPRTPGYTPKPGYTHPASRQGYQQPPVRPQPTPNPRSYQQPTQPQMYNNPQGTWQVGAQPTSSYNPAYINMTPTTNKNKILAAVLSFFLGWCGIQFFYMGKTLWGVLSLLFFWTYIPAFIGVVYSIIILTASEDKFNQMCKKTK